MRRDLGIDGVASPNMVGRWSTAADCYAAAVAAG